MMKKLLPHLRNKYAITALLFVIWLLFFDRNDLISQAGYRKQLRKLESDKEYYVKGIEQNQKDMEELMSDPEHLEKYAREHYLMKKDDEEIFLIIPDSTQTQEEEE
jgi:cell division protein FtsB